MGPCNYKISVNGKELVLNEHEFKGYLLKEGLDKFISDKTLKDINYASNVRSNEGQVSFAGNGPEGGQEQGGSNIQFEESAKPIPAEAEQQAGNAQQQQDKAEGKKVNRNGVIVEDWKSGDLDVISIDAPGLGTMELTRKDKDTFSVSDVDLKKELRGKGFGKKLYYEAIKILNERGLSLTPGHSTSPEAARVWKALEREGLVSIDSIEKNTDKDYPGDFIIKGRTTGKLPEYSVMEGGIPPNMFDLPFKPEEPDVNRLAHADTEQIYKDLGMADRAPRATKDDLTLEKEADALIRSGYDFEGKADRVLSGRDKSFTDAEQVAFAKMVGALNVRLQGLEVNTPEFNSTLDTIERLSRASDKVGSEEGAAFRARRMFVLNDETLSSFMQKAKEANLDVPLTKEQAEAVKARYDDIRASRDAYKARLEKLAAERSTSRAENAVRKVKSEKTEKKRTHEDYVKDRKEIIEEMRKALLKTAKGGGGALATIPGAPQLKAIAPHVIKLMRSLVEEGVDNLGDIVKNIHTQIKDHIDGVREKDVIDIIAGEYSGKQTKSDIQERLYNLKYKARLISQLESLRAGVRPKNRQRALKRDAEIEDIKKQIKELSDRPEKTESEKLNALKARYKSETERLQKKIDAGDFEPDEKDIIALDKEATDLKDAYIKKKIEWQKEIAKNAFNNRSLKDKSKDWAAEVLGIPRTIMSSMDLSAPLRQGLVLTTSHPIIASRAFKESLKQAIDPARFDRWLYDLKQSDFYKNIIAKSGLYIADPNNLHLSVKEEAYMSNLAEKVPVIGDSIKTKEGKTILPGLGLISKSERAYVSYLNKLRVDVFTMYAKGLAEKGITPENRPDVYEALGAFINAATGRGDLGDLERSAPILNGLFFSPRLIASRLNLLNPVFYASLPKEVRIMAVKDMAKMIGLGATTVGLLSLVPGVTTELNPTSPDFGKIKAGNTRWDVWGGFQQYIRLASQLISGYEKKANGNVVPLGPGRNQNTKADKFFSFFRGKLSPIPSLIVDYGTGKTAIGEDVELTSEMKEHLIPMIGNDVADAWKEQGPMSIVYTGLPSFLGVGTTTYTEKKEGAPKGKPHKNTKNTRNTKK